MAYKTILVHADSTPNAAVRMDIAARLALAEDGHLIGLASTGVSRFMFEPTEFETGDPVITPYLQTLRAQMRDSLDKFELAARLAGVSSHERRSFEDEAGSAVCRLAPYCDLVIVGQSDNAERIAVMRSDVAEYVALNAGCPVLVVPYAGAFDHVGEHVLIAWNGSAESQRAVHDAMPLLRRARSVEVAAIRTSAVGEAILQREEIAHYFSRHGVAATLQELTGAPDTGDTAGNFLLSHAADIGADLVVMGCHGHSRLRGILLGSVTRTIFQSMTLPVLMSG